jgi:hypothetical protein
LGSDAAVLCSEAALVRGGAVVVLTYPGDALAAAWQILCITSPATSY